MKIECSKVQELLAEDAISDEVQRHVRECFRCSDIATGLALLDEGLNNSPRHSASAELNDLVLLKLHAKPSLSLREGSSFRTLNQFRFRGTCLAITAFLYFLVFDPLQFDHNLQGGGNITTPLIALASKSVFELTQLAVVIIGLAVLSFSNIRKVLTFAFLFLSLVVIEAIRFLL